MRYISPRFTYLLTYRFGLSLDRAVQLYGRSLATAIYRSHTSIDSAALSVFSAVLCSECCIKF